MNEKPDGLVDEGVVTRVNVAGENYYLYVTKSAIMTTVPRENDPKMTPIREAIEAISVRASEILEGINNG